MRASDARRWRAMTRVPRTGEFGLIARVTARLPAGPACLLGPGDDAALVAAPDGRVVATTDVLVEGRHFRRDWSSAQRRRAPGRRGQPGRHRRHGRRRRRRCWSPCARRRDLPPAWAEELADGLAAECGRGRAPPSSAGDMSASPTLTIAVTALGDLGGRAPVLRSGARPGDVVAVAGRIGYAAAGYTVLSRGFRTPKLLVEAYRRPQVHVPGRAGGGARSAPPP